MQALSILTPPRSSSILRDDPADAVRCKGRYCLVTLGCPKNLVDSERMAGLLGLEGYDMVREPEGSDFVVINTCAFIDDSRAESHATIREMLDVKKHGKTRGVIVTGCLAQREKDKLLEMYPGVDQLVGVFGRDEIAAAAQRLLTGLHEQRTVFRPAPTRALADTHRLRITPRHLAYPEDFRGLQSRLHLLLDPADARQACQQADRGRRCRGRRTRGRRARRNW